MTLRMNVRDNGGITVLDLAGSLVMGLSSEQLSGQIQNLLSAQKSRIVVNVKGVMLIDSAGLGELVACHTRVKNAGGSLKLAHPTGIVDTVLKATHLLEVLDVYGTEKEALASFEGSK
jgi:anti-sigma B factor antagonist